MIVIGQDVDIHESEPYFSLSHRNHNVFHRCRNSTGKSQKHSYGNKVVH